MLRSIAFFAVVSLITIFVAAQDATPTPEPVSCTTDALKTYYAGLVAEAEAAFEAAPPSTTPDGAGLDAALLETLYKAGESLQKRMLDCGYIPSDIDALPVGADTSLERVLEILDTLSADPLRGQLLYLGEEPTRGSNDILGCAGCHEGGAIGPETAGTWTRWDEQHTLNPQYAEESFAYFAAEAILHPNAYVAPPYMENLMPTFYGQALSYQDLADLIAFLESQDQLLDE